MTRTQWQPGEPAVPRLVTIIAEYPDDAPQWAGQTITVEIIPDSYDVQPIIKTAEEWLDGPIRQTVPHAVVGFTVSVTGEEWESTVTGGDTE